FLFTCINDNTENMHQVKKALEEEHAYYIECIQVEQQRYEEAYAHHQKEQEYYSMAKTLNEQFEEQSKRQNQLQALLQEQDVYTVKEREIALAEKAERLVLVEQQCIDLRNELNRKEQSYQQALMEQQNAEAQLIVAQEKFNAEEAKEPERQRILQQEIQLQALLPKFEAYEHNLQQM
ncbi:SMC family ATPase, partial [Bacillus sp. MHSD17]|nr:SMC family ATPase [Bacillus sp. MHSD17]